MNHVHKDTKDLLYFIITLGNNIIGGGTVFYDGVKKYDLVNIYRVLKKLHVRMIFGPFEKNHEVTPWRGPGSVI